MEQMYIQKELINNTIVSRDPPASSGMPRNRRGCVPN
jgi:hypothetical protein